MAALIHGLNRYFPEEPRRFIFGACGNKDIDGALSEDRKIQRFREDGLYRAGKRQPPGRICGGAGGFSRAEGLPGRILPEHQGGSMLGKAGWKFGCDLRITLSLSRFICGISAIIAGINCVNLPKICVKTLCVFDLVG